MSATISRVSPSPSARCAESDNHFRELFYHPALQGVYNITRQRSHVTQYRARFLLQRKLRPEVKELLARFLISIQ